MLFSPPNEFDNLFFLKLIALTACVHIGLLGTLFFCESWFGSAPLAFTLKGPASPVSLLSGKNKGSYGRTGGMPHALGSKKTAQSAAIAPLPAVQPSAASAPEVKKKEVVSEPQPKPVQESQAHTPKKVVESKKDAQKKETSKKEAVEKKTKKNESLKKESDKKKAEKTASKKTEEKGSKKDSKKAQSQEEAKKTKSAAKKDVGAQEASQKPEPKQSKASKAEPLIESKLTTNVLSRAAAGISEAIDLPLQAMHGDGGLVEFDGGNGGMSADAVVQEFANHFTLPPGFDDSEPFSVTFEIHEGKVTHISPHGKESLVVYTAVKDALLKSTMPRGRNRKITLLIT